LEAELEVI